MNCPRMRYDDSDVYQAASTWTVTASFIHLVFFFFFLSFFYTSVNSLLCHFLRSFDVVASSRLWKSRTYVVIWHRRVASFNFNPIYIFLLSSLESSWSSLRPCVQVYKGKASHVAIPPAAAASHLLTAAASHLVVPVLSLKWYASLVLLRYTRYWTRSSPNSSRRLRPCVVPSRYSWIHENVRVNDFARDPFSRPFVRDLGWGYWITDAYMKKEPRLLASVFPWTVKNLVWHHKPAPLQTNRVTSNFWPAFSQPICIAAVKCEQVIGLALI